MLAFSGAGTVVRCGARALVGWDGCEVRLYVPCARVSPNVPCGFLAPPGVLPGTRTGVSTESCAHARLSPRTYK